MSAARRGAVRTAEEGAAQPAATPLHSARSLRKKRAPKWLWQALGAVAVVVVAALLIWQAVKPAANTTRYVTTTVQRGTLTVTASGNGSVVVAKSSSVSPQVSGTVSNLQVAVGSKVAAGQKLFDVVNDSLDGQSAKSLASYRQAVSSLDRAYQSVTQAEQQVEQAELQLAKDEQAYAAVRANPASTADQRSNAYDQIQISQTNVDAAQQGLDAARSGLTASKSSKSSSYQDYQLALANAAKRSVKAPIGGVVTSLNVQNGDSIGGGGTTSVSNAGSGGSNSGSGSGAAIVIADLGTMEAKVSVSEVDRAKIKVGQKTSLTFDALPNLTSTGKVSSIDAVGTTTQGVVTYNVIIQFDALDGRLNPGMTTAAAITTDVRTNVLIVPRSAVKSDSTGSYAQVMQGGQPQRVAVETGASTDSDYEVTSGLKEGDTVVTQSIAAGSAGTTGNSGSRGGFGIFGGGGGGRPTAAVKGD